MYALKHHISTSCGHFGRQLRLWLIVVVALTTATSVFAATYNQNTYYAAADGKKKAELKTAMFNIVSNHTQLGYSNLWTYYYETDRRSDNTCIDRYSNITYTFSSKGNAISNMNKEHVVPQSWWGGGTGVPIGNDLIQVIPSDGTANNRKSDYGMGVVTSPSWSNGSIKIYTNKSDASKSLWEPADNWKGDFARIFFYVATAYETTNLVQGKGSNTMTTANYPKLQQWAYLLYLQWAKDDPVDDIERARNEAVYKIQGNRNPFVDFPDLADYIWGSKVNEPFYLNADHSGTGTIPDPGPDDPDPDDPDDPDEPVVSGTIDLTQLTWTDAAHPTYGKGLEATANGLKIGYYKYSSNNDPIRPASELRLYSGSMFVISGATIKAVTFHGVSSNNAGDMIINNKTYSFTYDDELLLSWKGSL